MYTITTTPGFIIHSRSYGEAGKILSIFTRDLGLVSAIAQGIRLEKSKLRYHVRDYTFGTFSLVKGKEFWRLTSAMATSDFNFEASPLSLPSLSPSAPHLGSEVSVYVRIAILLKRLLHGEEPHPELFECLESVAEMNRSISPERLPEIESLTALRILNLLGYIGDSEIIRPFVHSHSISEEILEDLSQLRPKVNGIINASLQASHL